MLQECLQGYRSRQNPEDQWVKNIRNGNHFTSASATSNCRFWVSVELCEFLYEKFYFVNRIIRFTCEHRRQSYFRLLQLERVLLLENAEIDLGDLRLSCSFGVPDSLRPLCWRLLLGYLPVERQQWPAYLRKQREIYSSLVEDVIVHPGQSSIAPDHETTADHPLNLNPDSRWNNYFKDNEVLAQIDKDVRRLCPEIDFFQRITSYPHRSAAKINLSRRIRQENLYSEVLPSSHFNAGNFIALPAKTASKEYSNVVDENVEYHWQVVERVLFMYSKLNPGVKYVQGMNEIMGPLYYVFASDADDEWAEEAEADTYYCFQLLMSEIKDNFIKTLDSSNCGIESLLAEFNERLRSCDPELYNHLVDMGIKPEFYAFRWLSLLLSQEFSLPDVINIWDSLFSSPDRLRFLHWICLAMMEKVRDLLLEGDFTACLEMLQNYHETDVGELIVIAHKMNEGCYCFKNSCRDSTKSAFSKLEINPTVKLASAFSNVLRTLSKK
uniref:TBC domain-containing protein c n=1 Tax=Loa loa TaxID=7209 RepID=A0A1I7V818_LOALO